MRSYSTYTDSTDELAAGIDGQASLDRQGSREAKITHLALRKMILPCFSRAAKCYGGSRFLNRNFDTAKLSIVKARQMDEVTAVIDNGDYNWPIIAPCFRL